MDNLRLLFHAIENGINIFDEEFQNSDLVRARCCAAFGEQRHRFCAANGDRRTLRDDLGDPLLSPAATDVLTKIMTAIPAHLRPFISTQSTGVPPRLDTIEDRVDTETLRNAIRSRSKLHLTYFASNAEVTERRVWPLILGYADTCRILIAWCELRQGFRHFRTDRMVAATDMEEPVPVPGRDLHRRRDAWRAAELSKGAS